MKIKFCGAAQHVTGSSHLLTLDDGFNILLDCGMFQGDEEKSRIKNQKWYVTPEKIDCLILSHAHIDHTGRVPKLVKDGFGGRIYATPATVSLCKIMLADSALIQERDAEYLNNKIKTKKSKKKRGLVSPLYTLKDVQPAIDLMKSIEYNQWEQIHPNVKIMFRDAGHILGSAGVILEIANDKQTIRLGYTGDIGRPERPILRDPQPLPPVDYLMCESTYGDRQHEYAQKQVNRFLEIIKKTCIENKGKLIIPAFSVGRTQEIVYMLDRLETVGILPKIPVYVDSPLAVNATEVYRKHPECYDANLRQYLLEDPNPFGFNDLHYITNVEDSKALNHSQDPCIIISSAGMINAGRVVHHLRNHIDNPKNTFLIVGYCAPGTYGAALRNGAEYLKIFGEWKIVKAKVEVMDAFSAHGDQLEMFDVIKTHIMSAKKVFLVHGEPSRMEVFRNFLQQKGFKQILIPEEGQEFEI